MATTKSTSFYGGILKNNAGSNSGKEVAGVLPPKLAAQASSEPSKAIWQGFSQAGSGFASYVDWARKRLGPMPFWVCITFVAIFGLLALIDPPFVRQHDSYAGIYVPGQSIKALLGYSAFCAAIVAIVLLGFPYFS